MIARQLNPGHVVPVYPNLDWQMHLQCGCEAFDWAMPVPFGSVMPIQFPIPVAATSGWTWTLRGELASQAPTASFLTVKQTLDGTKAWVILDGYQSAIPADCDTYYIQFTNSTRGITYYSERFRYIDFTNKKKIYKLEFYNSTDVDGILYQTGYRQRIWLQNCVWDTPELIDNNENLTDGNAVEVLTFQSVQRRAVLAFPYLPDFWQGALHRIRMHDSVTLTKLQTNEPIVLNGNNPELAVDDQDICFKKGRLSWIESTQVLKGCETDYVLV